MSVASKILAIVALVNFVKVKGLYSSAKEEYNLLEAAVKSYNDNKTATKNEMENNTAVRGDGNSELSAVKVSFILRVGNLVGKTGTAQVTLVFSNTSTDKSYILSDFKAQPSVGGMVLGFVATDGQRSLVLSPGQTTQIVLPAVTNRMLLTTVDDRDALRNHICEVAGKKLITSCPNITIQNYAKANVEFEYIGASQAGSKTRAMYTNTNGVLRYCGEAFYPNNVVNTGGGYDTDRSGIPTDGPGGGTKNNDDLGRPML